MKIILSNLKLFCRSYVKAGGNKNSYTFIVPLKGCGSKPACSVCGTIENTLIIQTDDTVQELWDTARKISCESGGLGDKTVYFKPFIVDMLEVVNVPTQRGTVDCWMDIQVGNYPNVINLYIKIFFSQFYQNFLYTIRFLYEFNV